MTEKWPPDGYSSPKEYESSDRWTLVIGLALIFPVFEITRPELDSASLFAEWSRALVGTVGLSNYPLLVLTMALLGALLWIMISGAVIIILHEGVHYALGSLLEANPRFEFHTQLYLPNPSVVAYDKCITRGENIAMLSGPFVALSLVLASAMWLGSGFVSATAAIMFAINAVPSCGDLYHIGRIAMMQQGTLFANFEEYEGLRTEVVTPK